MRMEPGWLPYRRNAGQAVIFGGEARQLFCDRTQIGVDVSGHTGHIEDMETGKPKTGDTEMTTRIYKGHEITRNHDGKWIVRRANGSLSQYATLADAKEAITIIVDVAEA